MGGIESCWNQTGGGKKARVRRAVDRQQQQPMWDDDSSKISHSTDFSGHTAQACMNFLLRGINQCATQFRSPIERNELLHRAVPCVLRLTKWQLITSLRQF